MYKLILPSALDSTWAEVDEQGSPISGFGVFPQVTSLVDWSSMRTPILMPYLGVETVVHNSLSLKVLMNVLKGHFERTTLAEVLKV